MQLRDFLHDSLYHPTEGYFSAHKPPVGMGKPLNLPMLPSEDAYREEVRRQYDDLAVLPSHAEHRAISVPLFLLETFLVPRSYPLHWPSIAACVKCTLFPYMTQGDDSKHCIRLRPAWLRAGSLADPQRAVHAALRPRSGVVSAGRACTHCRHRGAAAYHRGLPLLLPLLTNVLWHNYADCHDSPVLLTSMSTVPSTGIIRLH